MIFANAYTLLMVSIITIIIFASYFSSRIFKLLVIFCPIFVAVLIIDNDYITYKATIFNFEYGLGINAYNKAICLAFSLVTLSATFYALGQRSINYKKIIVIGNLYYIASLGCILAIDWLSMFFCLEMMIITASLIILMNGNKNNIDLARQYFLTHLFSGSLMLIGIIYFISTGNTKIMMLTQIMQQSEFNILTIESFIYLLMLSSCLINVAAFPFSFWLTNCYPHASRDGLAYLINFTTKTSMLLIIKLFRGEQILVVFGVLTVIYGIIYAIRENNIRKLLCFLSIIQIGLMLISVSNDEYAIKNLILYISIHILYKCLLTICSGIYAEKSVLHCSELKKINNSLLFKVSLIVAICSMISLPLTLGFYAKVTMLAGLKDDFARYISYLPSIFLCLMLPIREYINSKQQITVNLAIYTKLSLLLLGIALFSLNIAPIISITNWHELVTGDADIYVFNTHASNINALVKQSLIILCSIIICIALDKSLRNKLGSNSILTKEFSWFCMVLNKVLIRIEFLLQRLKNYLAFYINYHNNKTQNYKLRINTLNASIYGAFFFLGILLLTLHHR